ncbi:MAG: formylglycine-generating enzyme family protein, partial [Acidobacteriota bacterium]
MDATIASIPSLDAEMRRGNEAEQFKTMMVPTSLSEVHVSNTGQTSFTGAQGQVVQQSHPSLQGSLHTHSSLGTIPDLGRGNRSKMLVGIIIGIVLLIVVVAGVGIAIFSSRSSEMKTAEQPTGPTTSESKTTNPSTTTVKSEVVKIEGGTFQMGRDGGPAEEGPAHSETVKPFYIDKTEVTNAQYAEFIKATKYPAPSNEEGEKPYWKPWVGDKPPPGQEQWPVRNVSETEAAAYANWLSNRDGRTYRLPTETEWEYVARNAGSTKLYPWGDEWKSGYANIDSSLPKPVGAYTQGATRA